ncbi:ComF family protein [Dongia soli]|uniref:ComF family protein n=1 Tax=Dongia soli TaxID=600628 RepID=A0ABU5E8I6_9PROT|nr:ComF family protein [Dongia soli]MDY0882476.1 ComF family protein [Dongia soli]
MDAVLPPRCLKCGALVEAQGSLCMTCWPQLRLLAPPCCTCCGYPFESDLEVALCAACMAQPPRYARARSVLAYDEGSRDLILAFKHADRGDLTMPFARWMARAGAELLAEADLIAPLPLHWRRLLFRRYNQAALLATAIGRIAGRPVMPDLLRRHRATPKQGHLSRSARRRNVQGAFRLSEKHESMIAGKRLLLIDDVITTGATVESCARILLDRGAAAVDVLALAQVIRPRSVTSA